MRLEFVALPDMTPLGTERSVYLCEIAGKPLYEHVIERARQHSGGQPLTATISDPLLSADAEARQAMGALGVSIEPEGTRNAFRTNAFPISDGRDLAMRSPWDLLAVMRDILAVQEAFIAADVQMEPGVDIRGNVHIGSGTRIFSGARIIGNVYIGENSFIGNDALIRGDVSIGAGSVVGFNANVTDSLLMREAQMGPVTYAEQAVIDEQAWFGGMVQAAGEPGGGKGGPVIGAASNFGIGVVIKPGVRVGANCLVGPHVVVAEDVPARKRVVLAQSVTTEAL